MVIVSSLATVNFLVAGNQNILSLKTHCDNTCNGCKWIGELRSLEKHQITCDFTLRPCPNKCLKDGKLLQLLQKDIHNHKKECPRRQYECSYCRESGEFLERTTTHLKECPMVEVPCPKRRCTEHILRCNIPKHRQECLYEEVPCKYRSIGCEKRTFRKDLKDHENDSKQHLQLAIDTVHQQQMAAKQGVRAVQLQSTALNYRVNDFDNLKTFKELVYSPAFYTCPGGYRMCLKVHANGFGEGEGSHVSVFAYLMRGIHDDHLPWPFKGTVTIELLNQLEDDHHYSTNVVFPSDEDDVSGRVVNQERSSTGYGSPRYIPHSALGYDEVKHCQYLMNDCLYFRVKAEAVSSSKPWLVNN